MDNTSFRINYEPVHPGTAHTDIEFYSGAASLFAALAAENPVGTERTSTGEGTSGAERAPSGGKRMYITDTAVAALPAVRDFLQAEKEKKQTVFILESGEAHKTAETVLRICETALKAALNRSSVFVGIGGGVVCDLCAFACSIFKRGALLELVPTTLLAMTDAAIGGKTGCDFGSYKNMLGTFYPARTIRIAPDFVQTLSEREFFSGLAEAVKTAMLYDKNIFGICEKQKVAVCKREKNVLADIIRSCAKAKAAVVEEDLSERGKRMELNLGHSFAHALESIAGFGKLSHGEAVAWGISRALQVSVNLGCCAAAYKERVFALLEQYGWCTDSLHPALSAKTCAADLLLQAMKQDKKNSGAQIRLILQSDLCSTLIKEVNDEDVLAVL